MKNFKSITIPESTFKILDKLKYTITKVPLSKSTVVSILAKEYESNYEKDKSNDHNTSIQNTNIR